MLYILKECVYGEVVEVRVEFSPIFRRLKHIFHCILGRIFVKCIGKCVPMKTNKMKGNVLELFWGKFDLRTEDLIFLVLSSHQHSPDTPRRGFKPLIHNTQNGHTHFKNLSANTACV